MKTYPIKFHPRMVQAIQEGRKTQTRRVIDPQPAYVCGHDNEEVWHPNEKELIECPYGEPGDQLMTQPADLRLTVIRIQAALLQAMLQGEVEKEGFDDIVEFIEFWDRLHRNTAHQWEASPWVWVIEFTHDLS